MVRHQELVVGKYYKIGNVALGYLVEKNGNDLIFTRKPAIINSFNHRIEYRVNDNWDFDSEQVTDKEYGTDDSDDAFGIKYKKNKKNKIYKRGNKSSTKSKSKSKKHKRGKKSRKHYS